MSRSATEIRAHRAPGVLAPAAWIGVGLAVAGCPAKDQAARGSDAAAAPAARVERTATAYRAVGVEGGRTIRVRVELAGRRQEPSWPIPRMVRSQCGGADHARDEALSASPDGGANGAVVWLDDIHEGRPLPEAAIIQDEKACAFSPHILALPAKGTLTLKNDDGGNHAVRFDFGGDGARDFMKTLPAGASLGVPLDGDWAGKVARVTCPIHLWMYGYALFFDHPYFAVTAAGDARLEGVPPGSYHLVVWHEGTTSTFDSSLKLSPPKMTRVAVEVGEDDLQLAFVVQDDGVVVAPR